MEDSILNKAAQQINNLKAMSEEIRLQMALGKAEAVDLFKKEKKALTKYLEDHKAELNRLENIAKEKKDNFLSHIETLESELLADAPTGKRDYKKYKSSILNKIYQIEEDFRDNYPIVSHKIQSELNSFKVKMDAFRLNLALHDEDQPEKVEELKAEFTDKLDSIRSLLSKQKNEESKIEGFINDVSTSFDFLKKAVNELT